MHRKRLRLFTYLLVIFFFITSVIPYANVSVAPHQESKEISLSKSSGLSINSTLQLLFEETEEEKNFNDPAPLLFVYFLHAIGGSDQNSTLAYSQLSSKAKVNTTPIYLSKRSLLI